LINFNAKPTVNAASYMMMEIIVNNK